MVAVDTRGLRRVLIVLLVSLAVMLAYWALWFTARDVVASNDRPAYVEFEDAFPAADGWLTLCLIGAALTLPRRRPSALFFLLAGGGAAMYLFGMDALYDLENGIWWRSGAGGVIEALINLLTLAAGVGLLRWSWRRRNALLGISPAG